MRKRTFTVACHRHTSNNSNRRDGSQAPSLLLHVKEWGLLISRIGYAAELK